MCLEPLIRSTFAEKSGLAVVECPPSKNILI